MDGTLVVTKQRRNSLKSFFNVLAVLFLSGFATAQAAEAPKQMILPPVEEAIFAPTPDMMRSNALKTPADPAPTTNVTKRKDTTVITSDYGGKIFEYIDKYNELRREHKKVRVEDYCLSACTLVTGLIPESDVCVTPFTRFGFHSAWVMTILGPLFHKEATRIIWNVYPENLQEALKKRGWDGEGDEAHPEFIYIKGTDLYELCKD